MSSSSDRMAALGHELKLLVDILLENSAPFLETLEAAGHGAGSAHTSDDADDGKPHPGWCPWCLLVDLARRDGPDLSSRAIAQTTQLISLLRAVLADRFNPGEGVHLPTEDERSEESPPLGKHEFPGDVLAAQSMDEPLWHGRHARLDDDEQPPDAAASDGDASARKPSPTPRRSGPRVQKIAVRRTGFADQAEWKP